MDYHFDMQYVWWGFFIAAPRPTLGNCWEASLTISINSLLITSFYSGLEK